MALTLADFTLLHIIRAQFLSQGPATTMETGSLCMQMEGVESLILGPVRRRGGGVVVVGGGKGGEGNDNCV